MARVVRRRGGTVLAVDRLCEDPCERRLAGAARACEEVRLPHLVLLDRVRQRPHDRLLSHDLREGLGAVLAVEGGHGSILADRAALPSAAPPSRAASGKMPLHASHRRPRARPLRLPAASAAADQARADGSALDSRRARDRVLARAGALVHRRPGTRARHPWAPSVGLALRRPRVADAGGGARDRRSHLPLRRPVRLRLAERRGRPDRAVHRAGTLDERAPGAARASVLGALCPWALAHARPVEERRGRSQRDPIRLAHLHARALLDAGTRLGLCARHRWCDRRRAHRPVPAAADATERRPRAPRTVDARRASGHATEAHSAVPVTDDDVLAETRAFNELLAAALAELPSVHTLPPEETRSARREGRGVFPTLVFAERARTIEIPGRDGPIQLRLV